MKIKNIITNLKKFNFLFVKKYVAKFTFEDSGTLYIREQRDNMHGESKSI